MDDRSAQLPCFQAIEPRTWSPNRLYRVHVLPDELLFLWAGSGEDVAAAVGVHFGLVGILVAAAVKARRKLPPPPAPLHLSNLHQIIAGHKHNFRAASEELSDVSIDPRSFWLAVMYQQPNHVGLLRFTHSSKGKVTLVIGTTKDLQVAVETLPVVLGDKVAVNVEWNERKGRYVGKK